MNFKDLKEVLPMRCLRRPILNYWPGPQAN